jgi:NodT family efflux transporter outer membrane factor (OMF) lipoprotein
VKTSSLKTILGASVLSLLSGCAAGPDFKEPAPALTATTWNVSTTNEVRSQPIDADPNPNWWNQFDDATLSGLIGRIAAANLDVRIATSRLQQSRAALSVVAGDGLPKLGAGADYHRQHATSEGHFDPSGNNGNAAFNHWRAGFDSSWELDIWGHVKRSVEAASASVMAAGEARRGVLITIEGEAAADYIQLRYTQTLRSIAEQNLAIANHSLRLILIRVDNGVATQLEVAEARAHIATIEAQLPQLVDEEARLINALSYLAGEQPGAMQPILEQLAGIPVVPDAVPVGLPSTLARRRPDIRRAAAQLHVATARIGVAEADFYPRVSLTGNFGFEALQLATLGSWGTHTFSIGPTLSLPIFEGGKLRGMLHLRESQQQEAAIQYQQTVLKAWHEVDNALTTYRGGQLQNRKLDDAVQENQKALKNVQQQYLAGVVDYLNVLSVQQQLLSMQQAAAQSNARVSLAMVALYKALGGGWENRYPDSESMQVRARDVTIVERAK